MNAVGVPYSIVHMNSVRAQSFHTLGIFFFHYTAFHTVLQVVPHTMDFLQKIHESSCNSYANLL